MGLLTPFSVPRGGFLYTMIVPRGGFLLPSSRVPGGWLSMKLIPALSLNHSLKFVTVVTLQVVVSNLNLVFKLQILRNTFIFGKAYSPQNRRDSVKCFIGMVTYV